MNHENLPPSEMDLLKRVMAHNSGRNIVQVGGSRWGRLITPGKDEGSSRTNQGLRVMVIGSWTLGMLAYEAVRDLEEVYPDSICIVGLVTDDPLDPNAKISLRKRFWSYYDENRREQYELDMIEDALSFGVPCYTGEVKCDAFREIMARWNPEAVIMAGFGQRIDGPIINQPNFGIYNVHPTDLRNGIGAGPQPWEEIIESGNPTSRTSVHKVTEVIDAGSVVGVSPPINIRLADDQPTTDVRLIGEKTFVPVKPMVAELTMKLCQKRESGDQGPIDQIDLESAFTPEDRDHLMAPLDPAKRGHLLPLPLKYLSDTV